MVADRGLSHVAACSEIARAHLRTARQLAQNRQASWVGGTTEQEFVRVSRRFHDK